MLGHCQPLAGHFMAMRLAMTPHGWPMAEAGHRLAEAGHWPWLAEGRQVSTSVDKGGQGSKVFDQVRQVSAPKVLSCDKYRQGSTRVDLG